MKMHKHLSLRFGQFLARTFKKHLLSGLVLHFFTTHLQTDRQKPYQIRFAHVFFITYVTFFSLVDVITIFVYVWMFWQDVTCLLHAELL